MPDNNLTLVRSLNTRRLAQIVLAFLACGKPMEVEDVCLWTGLNREAAGIGLHELKGMGFLGMQTLAHNKKIWIPGGNMLFVFAVETKTQLSAFPTTGLIVDVDAEYKNVSPTIALTSLTTETQLSAFPTTEKNSKKTSLNPGDLDILGALKDAGIHGKKARQLLLSPWITPDYIKAHWERIKTEEWENPQGMLIYRMEGEEPAPEIEVSTRKNHKHIVHDYGKKGKEITSWDYDVDKEAAEFTKHEIGCRCFDCSMIRLHGTSYLCQDCKHFNCECEDDPQNDRHEIK